MPMLKYDQFEYFGNPSVISNMSDSYYSLTKNLVNASVNYPDHIEFPAGVIIIGVACIESYINETIDINKFDDNVKRELLNYGTAIEKKLIDLKKLAKDPTKIDDELIISLKELIALRGKIVHFTADEEKPNDSNHLSKLQKLERYLTEKENYKELGSIDRLLSTQTANLVFVFVFTLLKSIHGAGYGTPSHFWQDILKPK